MFYSFCTFLVLIGNGVVVASSSSSSSNIPSFSLDSILNSDPLQKQRLHHVLTTTGLFQIPSSSETQTYLSTLCDCSFSSTKKNLHDGSTIIQMEDSTRRNTIATMTVGMEHPMALFPTNDDNNHHNCPSSTTDALEELRDLVAHVSTQVLKALDQNHQLLLLNSDDDSGVLLEDVYGRNYTSFTSISQASNQLEHFHKYEKKTKKTTNAETNTNTLDWHTDAGLFLAFVPAMNCNNKDNNNNNHENDSSFWFQNEHGQEQQAQFDSNSIVFMMGTGMQHWIANSSSSSSKMTPNPIKATRHAVRIPAGQTRVWYGMMHLVPEHAIIQRDPKTGQATTFGDLKLNLASANNNKNGNHYDDDDDNTSISMGCGHASANHHRRRLDTATDASQCNNSTNFFCWMTCMEIPSADKMEDYFENDYSLYCLDPSILAQTDSVLDATTPCQTGYVHNQNCGGKWKPTSTADGAIPSLTSTSDVSDAVQYCYGGTSMYMDGFHWVHETTCIIYLFPSWILNESNKLIAACFGTFGAGMFLEFILYLRKGWSSSSSFITTTLLYGLQLTMGYLLMLIIMTYSIPLFLSTIIGLMMGHAIWNAKQNLWNRYVINQRNSNKPEGTALYSQGVATATTTAAAAAASSTTALEGATPCCMNGFEDDNDPNSNNNELAA